MKWLVYFVIYSTMLFIPLLVVGMHTENTTDDSLLGKNNTQAMKGFAILIIMVCHMMGKFGGGITYFTPLGGIGVSIFLSLSAYGLNESSLCGGTRYWWRKRLITVFLPYCIMQSIIYWPFHRFTINSYLLDIALISPKYMYGWYLNFLLVNYIVFYLLIKCKVLTKYKIQIMGIVSLLFLLYADSLRAEQALSFLLGIIISEYKNKKFIERFLNWKIGIALIIFSTIMLALKQIDIIRALPQIIFNIIQLLIKLPAAIGICSCIIKILSKFNLRFLQLVGLISYELYLVHGNILTNVPVSLPGEIYFIIMTFALSVGLYYVIKIIKSNLRIYSNKGKSL